MSKLDQPNTAATPNEPRRAPAQPDKIAEVPPSTKVPREQEIGETAREYEHSSGDRNTRSKEDDWPDYEGGTQRNADPDGALRDKN